jgi:hypothetical protein
MANHQAESPSNLQIGATPSAMIENGFKWLETMTANMQSVLQAAQGAMDQVVACQEATVNFAMNRIQKNGEAAKSCLQPQGPAALVQSGVDYQRALVEDYARYCQDLVGATFASAKEGLDPIAKRQESTLSEVTKAA